MDNYQLFIINYQLIGDRLVYQLYELKEEEIAIIENSQ
jgi:hypothetical protein